MELLESRRVKGVPFIVVEDVFVLRIVPVDEPIHIEGLKIEEHPEAVAVPRDAIQLALLVLEGRPHEGIHVVVVADFLHEVGHRADDVPVDEHRGLGEIGLEDGRKGPGKGHLGDRFRRVGIGLGDDFVFRVVALEALLPDREHVHVLFLLGLGPHADDDLDLPVARRIPASAKEKSQERRAGDGQRQMLFHDSNTSR